VSAAAPPAAPAAAAGGDLVSFSPREDAWITVTESGGKVLLNRTVKAGETVALSGTLPLTVVVGRAAGVAVQVRGKPFDLKPIIKSGGIARFEVK
jgi:cytoskeleton protein RodZ